MHIRHILTAVPAAMTLLWATSSNSLGQGFTFEYVGQEIYPMTLGEAAWGDLDLDGRMDLVVTGLAEFDDPSAIGTAFINQGEVGSVDEIGDSAWSQIYLPREQGIRPSWLSSAAWSDVDYDGRPDFTISGATSLEPPYLPELRMYRLSDAQFEEIPVDVPGVLGGSIDWGDYDNDGDPDLLLTGESAEGYVTRIYERVGSSGTVEFEDSGIRLTDVGLGEAKFGDYDADGDLDIILTGDTGQGFTTVLYRNDGDAFAQVAQSFSALGFSSVDWGDFDDDGDLDVLLAGGFLSPLIVEGYAAVYRNDGNDAFTNINAPVDGMLYGAAIWGDYDNDGLLDILVSGATAVRSQRLGRLYRNEGGGVFRLAVNVAGLLFSEATLGDYDGDRDLDILQIGDGVTTQYRNDQFRVNDPPTAPTGLAATSAEAGAILSWDAASDPQTASSGLTYNIRIGTSAGAADVTAPLADLTTGRRFVSAMGNVQGNMSWPLRELGAGTYYWSVQALDNAFNPSVWASEATFSVSEAGGVTTDAEADPIPTGFTLAGSFPNPFASQTTIEYTLDTSQHLVAEVFTALGERVATLERGSVAPGLHRLVWNGRDAIGREVGAGVYLLRLESDAGVRTHRLVRIPR